MADVNTTITDLIRAHPIQINSRTHALSVVFYTGSWYRWSGGELVYCYERPLATAESLIVNSNANVSSRQSTFERAVNASATSRHYRTNVNYHEDRLDSARRERDELVDRIAHIPETIHRRLPIFQFSPLTDDVPLMNLPTNIKNDWLLAASELCIAMMEYNPTQSTSAMFAESRAARDRIIKASVQNEVIPRILGLIEYNRVNEEMMAEDYERYRYESAYTEYDYYDGWGR